MTLPRPSSPWCPVMSVAGIDWSREGPSLQAWRRQAAGRGSGAVLAWGPAVPSRLTPEGGGNITFPGARRPAGEPRGPGAPVCGSALGSRLEGGPRAQRSPLGWAGGFLWRDLKGALAEAWASSLERSVSYQGEREGPAALCRPEALGAGACPRGQLGPDAGHEGEAGQELREAGGALHDLPPCSWGRGPFSQGRGVAWLLCAHGRLPQGPRDGEAASCEYQEVSCQASGPTCGSHLRPSRRQAAPRGPPFWPLCVQGASPSAPGAPTHGTLT